MKAYSGIGPCIFFSMYYFSIIVTSRMACDGFGQNIEKVSERRMSVQSKFLVCFCILIFSFYKMLFINRLIFFCFADFFISIFINQSRVWFSLKSASRPVCEQHGAKDSIKSFVKLIQVFHLRDGILERHFQSRFLGINSSPMRLQFSTFTFPLYKMLFMNRLEFSCFADFLGVFIKPEQSMVFFKIRQQKGM